MKLTDKTLEAFEKWLIHDFYGYISLESINAYKDLELERFNTLPDSMKIGVYVDFFDSVGIVVDVMYSIHDDQYSAYINDDDSDDFKTRPEARTAAITKADQLYNEQNYPD